MTHTIGSSGEISNGITAFGHHSITGGCSRSQSSCGGLPRDPLLDLPPHLTPPPGGIGLRRQVHHRDRELARRRVCHRPLAGARQRRKERRRREQRMRQPRARAPVTPERRNRIQHHDRLLDRVDGATEPPVRLADLRVPRPARHPDHAVVRAAARDPGLEAGRLGHDARRPPAARARPAPCRPPPRTPRRYWSRPADRRRATRRARTASRPRTPSPRSRPSCRTPPARTRARRARTRRTDRSPTRNEAPRTRRRCAR